MRAVCGSARTRNGAFPNKPVFVRGQSSVRWAHPPSAGERVVPIRCWVRLACPRDARPRRGGWRTASLWLSTASYGPARVRRCSRHRSSRSMVPEVRDYPINGDAGYRCGFDQRLRRSYEARRRYVRLQTRRLRWQRTIAAADVDGDNVDFVNNGDRS
jgi:hypothetical protein